MSAPQGDEAIQVRRRRSPFAMVPHGLARDSRLSDKAFRMWVVLACYADADDRECFPSMTTLSADLGCSRASVWRAQAELVERGLLEVESGKRVGESNVFTLIDPVLEEGGVSRPRDTPCRAHATPPVAPTRHPGVAPTRHKQEPVEQEPGNKNFAADAAVADTSGSYTEDPIGATAHRLTVLAFEQPVKPAVRGGGGDFPAALGLIRRVLEAGVVVSDVEAAVAAGVEVWTLAGLQTAVAHQRSSRRDPRRRAGPSIQDDAARVAELEVRRKAQEARRPPPVAAGVLGGAPAALEVVG